MQEALLVWAALIDLGTLALTAFMRRIGGADVSPHDGISNEAEDAQGGDRTLEKLVTETMLDVDAERDAMLAETPYDLDD